MKAFVDGGSIENILVRDTTDLLASIGNSEAKAAFFGALALQPIGRAFSAYSLHDTFVSIQDDSQPAWADIGKDIPENYVLRSFEPIGAIARSEVSVDGKLATRYFVNRYGKERGLATAGLMLDFSLTHGEIALYGLVGGTNSKSETGKRAPEARIKILSQLYASGDSSVRVQDLKAETGAANGSIDAQLDALEKINLIDVLRQKRNDDERKLIVTDEAGFANIKLQPWKGEIPGQLHRYILPKLVNGNTLVHTQDLTRYLGGLYPNATSRQLRSWVTKTAQSWNKKGIAKIISDFGDTNRSQVRLVPESKDLVSDYLLIAQAIIEGDRDYLEWGKERAKEIISNPDDVNVLMHKARAASPFKNSESQDAGMNRIVALFEAGETLTTEELRARVTAQGKSATDNGVRKLLTKLVDAGRVQRTDINRKSYFTII